MSVAGCSVRSVSANLVRVLHAVGLARVVCLSTGPEPVTPQQTAAGSWRASPIHRPIECRQRWRFGALRQDRGEAVQQILFPCRGAGVYIPPAPPADVGRMNSAVFGTPGNPRRCLLSRGGAFAAPPAGVIRRPLQKMIMCRRCFWGCGAAESSPGCWPPTRQCRACTYAFQGCRCAR